MGKKILDSKALYVVLSVIIAVSLWFYVASQDEEMTDYTIYNVPVQFEGLDVLENRNLMIVGDTPKVNLKFKSTYRTYVELVKSEISVKVDVSSIAAPQEYSMGYTVTYPASLASFIQPISQSPTNVTFTVARYVETDIPVRGVFDGSVAEGYLPGDSNDFVISPSVITVSGQEELVNQVVYARVVVSGDELTESVSGEYSYQLMSNSGEVLDGLDVECSVDTVYVDFPIWETKDVALVPNFIYGGGVTDSNLDYDMNYDTIKISGSKADLASVTEIVLESIDLANVQDGDVITRKIPLANELNNLSGYTEVSITIHINGVETKSVQTTNIRCINVPDGWNEELITQAMTVTVRGPQDELETISGDNVIVVADLTDVNPSAGQVTVTAKVYLASVGTEAGILGTDYRVVVSLSR